RYEPSIDGSPRQESINESPWRHHHDPLVPGSPEQLTVTADNAIGSVPGRRLQELDVVAVCAGIVGEARRHHEEGMEGDAIQNAIKLDIGEPSPDSLGHSLILLNDL